MNILIIGSGGREHALAWKVAQSPLVTNVFVAPGNAGTAQEAKTANVPISAIDLPALLTFVQNSHIDLTIVGPEAPAALGIVDLFRAHNLKIFGPTQFAAQLESSKTFSKKFMLKHNISTAFYESFTDVTEAKNFIRRHGTPIVIKADGLASGKGVVIAQSEYAAFAAVEDMLRDNLFGEAGSRVIVEEFLRGEEATFIVMCDGEHALAMATSQDHKCRDDHDKGPNTGGMGAYSPAPVVTDAIHEKTLQEVIMPVLRGMAAAGHPYTGFLYAGLMIMPNQDIKVLEFNCRLGDPETQPIMLRLRSDLVELCLSALSQGLSTQEMQFDPRPAVGVVMASTGYPGEYPRGDIIYGLEEAAATDVKVFQAGTIWQDNNIVTHRGRVLCVTALGDTVQAAQQHAYASVAKIHWQHEFYRKDIASRACHNR